MKQLVGLVSVVGCLAVGVIEVDAESATNVTAGGSHTCALTPRGNLVCWGDNQFGQLGDGTMTNRGTPVAVSGLSSGVAAIALGRGHTCALTPDGGVVCWGDNASGQLGNGTMTNPWTPTPVSGLGSGVAAVAAGESHTCALTAGGGVVCWGAQRLGSTRGRDDGGSSDTDAGQRAWEWGGGDRGRR
jgi:alpha-tubulin suppressor-like RCC1 family protein